MTSGGFRFDRFSLDPADRQLRRDDVPVELNARYLDALTLLVSEGGKLVSKDRFLGEVWRGVPVTDEALTQCIKTLRRQLGDDAARPRFIETVPKHGYRFIAAVEPLSDAPERPTAAPATAVLLPIPWRQFFLLGGAGTMGAGIAGIFGGLFYGLAATSHAPEPGIGAVSVLLVLTSLTMAVALLGGAGVAFGIAAARFSPGRPLHWHIIGGAAGGLLVGGIVKLLGMDAFNLLFGQSLGNITGALEGAALGGAIGLGAWLGSGSDSLRRAGLSAAAAGGAAGLLIPLLGGRMMGGSLALLARAFPGSRLRMDQIGALFGETGFGPLSQSVTGALEGALFGGCVVGAMLLARRNLA